MAGMLVGREAERSLIRGLLDDARAGRGAVLVVRGEPGVGKSALLADAREAAADMEVLAARGVEAEAQLPFAALHQLVRPVLGDLETLPDPQAEALRRALGLDARAGDGDDRFLVALAVLSLLAEVARRRPALCLIDDAHWLDDASADALVFVARRLHDEAVAMLFASREAEARRLDAASLPELGVQGLDPEAAAELLDRRAGVTLPPDVREGLIAGTRGNPLALLELPGALDEAALSGVAPLEDPLPVSARVERAFLARARDLPEETQALLLVAAADEAGDLATVLRAARSLGADPDALDAAEEKQLLTVRGARLEFRHPLVSSAVYHGAPSSRRREAHRALAGALEGDERSDRRVWHLAAASIGPDASVAGALERAAARARDRSGFAAASLALERAASLTADDASRARRLAAAAEDARQAGRLERAATLLERARALASDPVLRSDVDRSRGLIQLTSGVPAEAYATLVGAARSVAPVDGVRALYLLAVASPASGYAGDREAWTAIAGIARHIDPGDAPDVRFLRELLLGLGAHAAGDFAAAAPHLRAALASADELDPGLADSRPGLPILAGATGFFLGDDQVAQRYNSEIAARARARGALGILAQVLPRLGHIELAAGRWQSAEASAREGLGLAREIGQHVVVAHLLAVRAITAALRGDEAGCRPLAHEALELAVPHGLAHVSDLAGWALAILDLGAGEVESADGRLKDATAPLVALWTALDRIEAAARADHPDRARAQLDEFAGWAAACGAPWAAGVAAHGRALLAEDADEAERCFAAALDAHRRSSRPFERARAELAFGELLRRHRHRVEAREHLRAALERFEGLGARVWAERARVELRASGLRARRRDPSTSGDLTAQELLVARSVGQGLTNRDVAAQLFLSPRTIDFHLRNVFRKLGVTTRTELARLDLDSAGPAPLPGDPAISPARD
jgi:DNA-binding CsgD family transcriptional regulator/tetratricopeptide (TPR) repeat protein